MNATGGGETQAAARQSDESERTRAYGTLATRLTEALARGRDALAPHAAQLPDGALAELDALLAEFARRRVRIALYGEVKAGKSTLLNAIAGAALSPIAFEPLTSLPLRVTYGAQTTWRVDAHQLADLKAVEEVMRRGGSAEEIVVETDLDLLELGGQVDLLDTPGVGSATEFDAISAATLRTLDAVILVVRYPALFTEFTRRLTHSLREDIGRLFVVWNLDADCAELSADERTRHAETLRAQVPGAHELFLVDARAGFRAMLAHDGTATVASGLSPLIAALRRFVSSGAREVVALREAAKRAQQRLSDALQRLTARQATLHRALTDARAQLQRVREAADAETAAIRRRHSDFETAVAQVADQTTATFARCAADLRRQLRRARRRWIRDADIETLRAAVDAAADQYADAAHSAADTTAAALDAAAVGFGATLATHAPGRAQPAVTQLAPEERLHQASIGRWQLVRRALWRRWYVPGVAALEAEGARDALDVQAAWLHTSVEAARSAAQSALAARLLEISERADAQIRQVQRETDFAAREEEFQALTQHLPIVSAELEAVVHVTADARALFEAFGRGVTAKSSSSVWPSS